MRTRTSGRIGALAALAVALAAGRSPAQAAELAVLAAGVTVQKLFQTGTAGPDEILALAREQTDR